MAVSRGEAGTWCPGVRSGNGKTSCGVQDGVQGSGGGFEGVPEPGGQGRGVLELCCVCGSPAGVPGALQWDEKFREPQGSARGPHMQSPLGGTGRI